MCNIEIALACELGFTLSSNVVVYLRSCASAFDNDIFGISESLYDPSYTRRSQLPTSKNMYTILRRFPPGDETFNLLSSAKQESSRVSKKSKTPRSK